MLRFIEATTVALLLSTSLVAQTKPATFSVADSLIQSAVDKELIPGAVLVVSHNGNVVHERAFGFAELYDFNVRKLPNPRQMHTSTLFDLASVTKVMATTMGVMLLVDRGKVDIDKPVYTYLPEFRGPHLDSITVRHLLQHSSGLVQWQPIYYHAKNKTEAYKVIRETPLQWGVGEGRHYSDLGFMLLGYLIERVSGKTIDAFLEQELYQPLGLRNTLWNAKAKGRTDIAATEQGNGYEKHMVYDTTFNYKYRGDPKAWNGWRNYVLVGETNDGNSWYAHGGIAGHAGLFSTASDVRVLIDLLLNHGSYNGRRLIRPAVIDTFLTRDKYQNFLGWMSPSDLPAGSFSHTGFTGTYVLGVPSPNVSIVLFTNKQNVGANPRGVFSNIGPLDLAVAKAVLAAVPAQRGAPAATPGQTNVAIPMRDGVTLGADVYLPSGQAPYPTLLTITPYGKNGAARSASTFNTQGYAVVAVDSRGLRASKGKWEPYIHEAQDGYDVQEWVGRQSWSNGKIGMFGTSYPAYTQVAPAQFRSKYVKALVPVSAQSDNYGSVWYSDGILHLAFAPTWAAQQEAIATNQPAPTGDWTRLAWTLPLRAIPDKVSVRSQFLADVITHDAHDEFWKRMSVRDKYGEMDVPALHVTGWYDDLSQETQINFVGMRNGSRTDNAKTWQRLLIGPWGHGVPRLQDSTFKFGDVDFGSDVRIDFQSMQARWFDFHVKGIQNGVEREAPVKIFVMGANKWRDEQEWPLARARATKYFFHSKGFANTRFGDGTLSTAAPVDEPPDRYRYDPRNPVPTYGGHGCCDYTFAAMGPLDQRVNQQRSDVLVYSSPPLTEDTEVSGFPEVQLTFTTDVTDTDFFVTLTDVYPDGKAINVTEGQLRTRFRESTERPSPLVPNREYTATIKLWGTSNVFKRGHRIRVAITSSNFPRFARNLNSGKPAAGETEQDIRVANQTVHHSGARASAIVLPIVPASPTP